MRVIQDVLLFLLDLFQIVVHFSEVEEKFVILEVLLLLLWGLCGVLFKFLVYFVQIHELLCIFWGRKGGLLSLCVRCS